MSRRARATLFLVILAAAVGVGAARLRSSWRRDQDAFKQAAVAVDARRFDAALPLLEPLVAARPDWAEARLLLGLTLRGLGRESDAVERLAAIEPTSPLFPAARLEQSRAEEREGRLRSAEAHAREVLARPGETRAEARRDLVRMLRAQGRDAEALRLFDQGRAQAKDLSAWIRERRAMVSGPPATDGLEAYYRDLAARPGRDELVALGEANLATALGRSDQADRLLKTVESIAPDDPAVRAARLRWGVAFDRPDVVAGLLDKVSAADLTPDTLVDLALRLAAKRSPEGELAEIRRLQRFLTSSRLRERELVLLGRLGRSEEAKALKAANLEIDRRREAFRAWLERPDARSGFDPSRLARPADLGPEAEIVGLAPGGIDALPAGARLSAVFGPVAPASAAPSRARPAPFFRDVAGELGLKFIHENGAGEGRRRRLTPPVTASGGVALLDYDGDGRLDVYATQGGPFPPAPDPKAAGDRLFRQKPDGSFEDATDRAGLGGRRGYSHGVAVGDVDDDGRPDLFVTRWGAYALYRNRGDGTFEDVTERWGLGGDRDWPTSAAFADLDGDGDLDLYVCHYLKWDRDDPRPCVDKDDPTKYNCSPRDFPALPDHLFRNDGGRFVDASESAGIVDKDGRGLGVVAADLDQDGRIDLYVANDMSANFFFRNLGGLRFEETALASGAAANASGGFQAGMGVACGDQDGDGLPDLVVTNFFNESSTLFRNLGGGMFGDESSTSGLAAPSRYLLGFGVAFLDADADGRLDLITANGHVHDGRPRYPWTMPLQLLAGAPAGRFVDVSARAGDPFAVPRLGRGLAVGDVDDDGRVDVVVVSQNGPLSLLRNETKDAGAWISFALVGTRSGKDAVGAVVRVETPRGTFVRSRVGGGSYQSASDPRIHVGLGDAATVESVEVEWPSGRRDRCSTVSVGKFHRWTEGEAAPVEIRPQPSRGGR